MVGVHSCVSALQSFGQVRLKVSVFGNGAAAFASLTTTEHAPQRPSGAWPPWVVPGSATLTDTELGVYVPAAP